MNFKSEKSLFQIKKFNNRFKNINFFLKKEGSNSLVDFSWLLLFFLLIKKDYIY